MALYGLRSTPRVWEKKRIDRLLMILGFIKNMSEYGVYVHETTLSIILICLYVEDLLLNEREKI